MSPAGDICQKAGLRPRPARFGAPWVSRDGRYLAVNKWNEGVQLLRYQ
jgi:hypothetical protein